MVMNRNETKPYMFYDKTRKIYRKVFAFAPSEDFATPTEDPQQFYHCEAILMTQDRGDNVAERVPINEDLWREIGKTFGYRFREVKKK